MTIIGSYNKKVLSFGFKTVKIILPIFCLLIVFGCATTSDHPQRTDLGQWKTVDIKNIGISIEMPIDEFHFQLHPQSNGFMVDYSWMISVSVKKISEKDLLNYSRPSLENNLSYDQKHMEWLEWSNSMHHQTNMRQEGKRREYRRDYISKNEMIVRIHVEYNFAYFTELEQQEDEAAINRIIESVKFMNEETSTAKGL